MRHHQELQRKSGLMIEAYCKRENISSSNWWYWRKRLLSKKISADKSARSTPVSFLQLPTLAPDAQKFDLTLPNGARISMPISCDLAFLRQTIRMLSALRPR